MELVYSMRRKPLKCEPPHFDSSTDSDTVRPICTISTANIIAFSSPTELSDVDGDTWGGHVYVCDLDTPWNSFKVTSTSHPVSALEWDVEGKQLLIATSVGEVSVWGQRDFLLNDWHCLYTATFAGEHIIKGAFFHNGRRVVLVDKKPEAPILDRIQTLRSAPTLKGFGGVPAEGACVVTATGLVGVLQPRPESTAAITCTEALRATRDRVTAASIAHKNGNVVIAAVCVGSVSACVRVCVWGASARAPPALQPLPAVYMLHDTPASIAWCSREDTDSLLIAGSTLTLWKCTERAHPVHKLLAKGPVAGSTTPAGAQKPASDTFNTVIWQKTGMWAVERERATSVCGSARTSLAPHAVLATPTHLHLHLLHPDQGHLVCSRQVQTHGAPGQATEAPAAGASPPKKPKYGPGVLPSGAACASVSHVDVSVLGGVVVCVDTHAQLHVYRLPQPWHDIPTAMSLQHAASLLEYSMVSGCDCLDVLLTLKHNMIEPLYERITETFQRQPPAFQQYYYHSWIKLKMALCRLSPSLSWSCSWLACVVMASATLAASAAVLRDDRADAPPLDDDDDKYLCALESKPELLSEALPLAPLRLGLQRARDIALTIAAYPQHQHGLEVWSEPTALSVLRKLIVLWRMCARAGGGGGGGGGGAGGDALSRLLARVNHPHRSDVIEECNTLALQYNAPRVWECPPRCAVSAPHGRQYPLYLEYGVEPESLRYTPEPPPFTQCDNVPPQAMDSIRYMYLGGGAAAAKWRECVRCGARALPVHSHTQRHPLQRAYDGRFLPACRCGGKWSLCKNT